MISTIENYENVAADGAKFIYNPVTKRNVKDNKRNRISVIKQIEKYNIANPPTTTPPTTPTQTPTPTTTEPIQPPQPTHPQPTPTTPEQPKATQSDENRKLFNKIKIASRSLNLYIATCDEVDDKLNNLNDEINKNDNNNQLRYIAKLNQISSLIDRATKYLLKIFKKVELPYKERLPIVAFYNEYQKRHTEATETVKSFKYYANDEAEEEANKYHKEALIAHHTEKKINQIKNIEIAKHNKAVKKINNLYTEQMKSGHKTTDGVTEIIITGSEIRDNIDIDYQYIYNQCTTDTEKALFKKKFKNKIKFADDDESDQ